MLTDAQEIELRERLEGRRDLYLASHTRYAALAVCDLSDGNMRKAINTCAAATEMLHCAAALTGAIHTLDALTAKEGK